MYEQIKNDIAQDYYQQNFSNDGQRFVAWYLRNIHNLDPLQAAKCLTDGKDDKQIDAVYIDEDASTIYVIQGKFYNAETIDATPLREITSSWLLMRDLEKLQINANPKLKNKINEISRALEDDYEICFELIVTSKLTPAAQSDLEVFQTTLAEDENFNAVLSVVDNEMLKFKYEESLNKQRPYINYKFSIEPDKCLQMQLAGTTAVIAAIPLKECIKIPGIKDGSLFRKNVRQSLGNSNKVNKSIAQTLRKNSTEFFFLHNGITAICSRIKISGDKIEVKDLNVVNGCQSLNTIYSCSESVRKSADSYIMFRFYEISNENAQRADNISTATNSQSAVKARDLRSNDKYVLIMKRNYEQCFSDGYFKTKRGEIITKPNINQNHVVELSLLGKQMIAWHCQRPNIAYSESKIFDKYFDRLFHRDYSAENIQALNELYNAVISTWTIENPLSFNESLLALKSSATFHHLFAISALVSVANKKELIPSPAAVIKKLNGPDLAKVIQISGKGLNRAFKKAQKKISNNKIFSAQNWLKSKTAVENIQDAVEDYYMTLQDTDENFFDDITVHLKLNDTDFETRWSADD